MPNNLIINGCQSFDFDISIPGDKSITHRAIILASMCKKSIQIVNPLLSDDCVRTIEIMQSLGSRITEDSGCLSVTGNGYENFTKPKKQLYAGNSGTLIRLISGILSMQNFESEITGDSSLNERPMMRICDPLYELGCKIQSTDGKPPLHFIPSNPKSEINFINKIASAQVKSCMLLASIFLKGDSKITEVIRTRDHTERLLEYLGYPISINENEILIKGSKNFEAKDISIPGDFSSAAFFIVATLLNKKSKLILRDINVNKYRIGLLNTLISMGAKITLDNQNEKCNEDVADIIVSSSNLKPLNISGEVVSTMIDELPILFIACATCDGVSEINDIDELVHKETNRIKTMVKGLNEIGIRTESSDSHIKIYGGEISGGIVDSFGDHRVAMSFAIAAFISKKPITILNTNNIRTSFPDFVDKLIMIGAEVYES